MFYSYQILKKGGKRTLSNENTFSFYKKRIELKTKNECYKNGFMSCYCDKPFFSVYNVPNVRFCAYFSMKFLFFVHIGLKGCEILIWYSQGMWYEVAKQSHYRMLALDLKSIISTRSFFFDWHHTFHLRKVGFSKRLHFEKKNISIDAKDVLIRHMEIVISALKARGRDQIFKYGLFTLFSPVLKYLISSYLWY